MKKIRQRLRPTVSTQWVGTPDNGCELEVLADFNAPINGYSAHVLMSIFAHDEDESLWCEMRLGDHLLEIPFDVLAKIVQAAPEGVHSETWYEKNGDSKESDA